MDTTNCQKKSPPSSERNNRTNLVAGRKVPPKTSGANLDYDHLDHSSDLVARVRAAKEAAQRAIEAFGDVSEYEVRIIQGQKKEPPELPSETSKDSSQPTLAFDAEPSIQTEEN